MSQYQPFSVISDVYGGNKKYEIHMGSEILGPPFLNNVVFLV